MAREMRNVPVAILMFTMVTVLTTVCACGITASNGEVESCDSGEEPCFGIYLVDSRELVLSEHHIKAYRRDTQFYGDDTHVIELNEEGIQKWNSYMTWETIPKQADSLHSRDFVLKVEGKEIYQGKFYSGVSSASYPGVVIMDAVIELDNDHNTIRIEFGYPGSGFATGEDPRNSPEVIDFFEKQGLLK